MSEVDYTKEENYTIEFNKNLNLCINEYRRLFNENSSSLVSVCAPGRVNLIGEHTDYNDGFVFPMAIPLYTIIVGALNNDSDGKCRIKSLEPNLVPGDYTEFNINELKPSDTLFKWSNYIKGVVANYKGTKKSFNAVIKSNVPLGSGLSSSASLEVATYTLLENLVGDFTDPKQKALSCQRAEHEYALVPCGIMDQFISIMGKNNCALLIDCRSLESNLYELTDQNISIVITNSNVKHELSGSEYPDRRRSCEKAAKLLNKKSLRDCTLKDLNDNKELFDEITFKRAKHAISEIERTVEAAEALKSNDMTRLGLLMNDSHYSLKNDFEVSCNELDNLVEIALKSTNVYGSRMTGGGFGGCTVTLVKKENVNELINNIKASYKGKPTFYVCRPCDGSHKIQIADENQNY